MYLVHHDAAGADAGGGEAAPEPTSSQQLTTVNAATRLKHDVGGGGTGSAARYTVGGPGTSASELHQNIHALYPAAPPSSSTPLPSLLNVPQLLMMPPPPGSLIGVTGVTGGLTHGVHPVGGSAAAAATTANVSAAALFNHHHAQQQQAGLRQPSSATHQSLGLGLLGGLGSQGLSPLSATLVGVSSLNVSPLLF